ncbi:hypothetical protein P8452_72586 [Trifolium repens]|jgi:hypothetical protein|nr:hypothetical protein P8452_72586 [Trifolium repens]
MEACVTPTPKVLGGDLKPFPNRLYAIPPRVSSGSIPGVSSETYQNDNREFLIMRISGHFKIIKMEWIEGSIRSK